MSAPGVIHERLRSDLDSLAILSGHHLLLSLGEALRPDVARCDLPAARFFVGDAKDTETAATADTVRRLRPYLVCLALATRRGWEGTFAVAHAMPSSEWLALLVWLCDRLGLAPTTRNTESLSTDLTVSWVAFGNRPGLLQP